MILPWFALAAATSVSLPAGTAMEGWAEAAAQAGVSLVATGADVEMLATPRGWRLTVPGTARAAEVGTPSTGREREAVMVLAASLAEPLGPEMSLLDIATAPPAIATPVPPKTPTPPRPPPATAPLAPPPPAPATAPLAPPPPAPATAPLAPPPSAPATAPSPPLPHAPPPPSPAAPEPVEAPGAKAPPPAAASAPTRRRAPPWSSFVAASAGALTRLDDTAAACVDVEIGARPVVGPRLSARASWQPSSPLPAPLDDGTVVSAYLLARVTSAGVVYGGSEAGVGYARFAQAHIDRGDAFFPALGVLAGAGIPVAAGLDVHVEAWTRADLADIVIEIPGESTTSLGAISLGAQAGLRYAAP